MDTIQLRGSFRRNDDETVILTGFCEIISSENESPYQPSLYYVRILNNNNRPSEVIISHVCVEERKRKYKSTLPRPSGVYAKTRQR